MTQRGCFASGGQSKERQKNRMAKKSSLVGAAYNFPRTHFAAPDFLPICPKTRIRIMPTDGVAIPRIKYQADRFCTFSRHPWYCHAIRRRLLFETAGGRRNDSRRIH